MKKVNIVDLWLIITVAIIRNNSYNHVAASTTVAAPCH